MDEQLQRRTSSGVPTKAIPTHLIADAVYPPGRSPLPAKIECTCGWFTTWYPADVADPAERCAQDWARHLSDARAGRIVKVEQPQEETRVEAPNVSMGAPARPRVRGDRDTAKPTPTDRPASPSRAASSAGELVDTAK